MAAAANLQNSTRALFLENAYLFNTSAKVTAIGTTSIKTKPIHWIQLDQTIFYPQGGGQRSDQGTIDGHKVHAVTKIFHEKDPNRLEINHCFEKEVPFKIGQTVKLEIDPHVRTLHMRLHTAGHAIGHFIEKRYPDVKVSRAQHFPGDAWMQFKCLKPLTIDTKEVYDALQGDLDTAIKNSVKTCVTTKDAKMRELAIGDFPPVPCGGTHVAGLNELGEVKITKVARKNESLTVVYDVK